MIFLRIYIYLSVIDTFLFPIFPYRIRIYIRNVDRDPSWVFYIYSTMYSSYENWVWLELELGASLTLQWVRRPPLDIGG